MAEIRIKRGTRAQLDAAASANGLLQGEPYLITDESKLAVGSAVNSYIETEPAQQAASQSEMEAGTESAIRSMSPLRVKQAIDELAITSADVQTDAADRTEGRIARIDLVPMDPFREVCHIAGMEPTLYLDFSSQDYRLYNSATGLERKALTDILDSTSGDIRNSTGTAYNALALLEEQAADVPRLDFDPETGICRGVLVEESRENKFLNSLVDGTNLSTQTVTVTAANWTISFYGSGSITLSGAHTATITGTDDTTRTELTFTPSAGSLTCTVSGTVKWANCELGAFATSHIPTAGAAATRAADTLTISGTRFSDFYRQDEGSFVFSADFENISGADGVIQVDDGSNTNRIYIYTDDGANIVFRRALLGETNANFASCARASSYVNSSFGYSLSSQSTYLDGASIYFANLVLASGMTQMEIGQVSLNANGTLDGRFKRLVYFPRRLTNTQLQLLSSLGA